MLNISLSIRAVQGLTPEIAECPDLIVVHHNLDEQGVGRLVRLYDIHLNCFDDGKTTFAKLATDSGKNDRATWVPGKRNQTYGVRFRDQSPQSFADIGHTDVQGATLLEYLVYGCVQGLRGGKFPHPGVPALCLGTRLGENQAPAIRFEGKGKITLSKADLSNTSSLGNYKVPVVIPL